MPAVPEGILPQALVNIDRRIGGHRSSCEKSKACLSLPSIHQRPFVCVLLIAFGNGRCQVLNQLPLTVGEEVFDAHLSHLPASLKQLYRSVSKVCRRV